MANQGDLAVLKKQRSVIKGCTHIKTYVDAITAVNPTITAQLEERKIKLEQYWVDYNSVQSQIETQENVESDDQAAFEDAFYGLSGRIREILSPPGRSRSAAVSPTTVSETRQAAYGYLN